MHGLTFKDASVRGLPLEGVPVHGLTMDHVGIVEAYYASGACLCVGCPSGMRLCMGGRPRTGVVHEGTSGNEGCA